MQHIIPMELTDLNSSISMKLRPTYGGLPEYGTAEGDIASFITNINYPLKKLEADIVAQQDLHGYSHPWAGRAGNNQLNYINNLNASFQDVTISATSNGGIHISGTPMNTWSILTTKFDLNIPSGTAITFSRPTARPYRLYLDLTFSDSTTDTLVIEANGTSVTRTWSKAITQAQVILATLSTSTNYNEDIYPMLNTGTTALPWEPYANICPINGFDEVVVNVAGKNLWTGESSITRTSGAFYIGTGTGLSYLYPISIPKGTVYFSADWQGVDAGQEISLAYADGTLKRFGSTTIPANSHFERYVTLEEDAVGIFAYINQAGTLSNIMLSYEANADYEPYNGNTYTTDLDGTRYGGTLDVTTGMLTVTHGFTLFNGTEDWVNSATNVRKAFRSTLSAIKPASTTAIDGMMTNSITLSVSDDNHTGDVANMITCRGTAYQSNIFYIFAPSNQIADVTALKTYLASNPLQVVYPLLNPQTVQLTEQEVESVCGQNHIWANSGQVYVEYHYVEDFEE